MAPSASDNAPLSPHAKEGLPKVEKSSTMLPVFMFVLVPCVIGFGVAFAVYTFGSTEKYDAKIKTTIEVDLHYAFAAAFVVGVTTRFINVYPTAHKSAIMLPNSHNLRSNPFIFKAIGPDAASHHVVFDDEGSVGQYNRANRSLHHMVENNGIILVGTLMGAYVFPFPALCCVIAWALGRIVHQIMYAAGGYGAHALGFLFAFLASTTLEGLLGFVALKGFGLLPAAATAVAGEL